MHFLLFLPSFLSLSHLSSPVPSCFILWMDVPKKELMRFSPWLYLDVDSKIEEVWGHSGRGQAATLLGTFGVEDLWFRGWKSDSTSVEDVVKVFNTENVGHEWNQKKRTAFKGTVGKLRFDPQIYWASLTLYSCETELKILTMTELDTEFLDTSNFRKNSGYFPVLYPESSLEENRRQSMTAVYQHERFPPFNITSCNSLTYITESVPRSTF